ncbi:MAG: glycosyltransferase [Gammaproteobacteria bacterium]|nr:glycosyltransferase [Gammaproteobacteria bacterium]
MEMVLLCIAWLTLTHLLFTLIEFTIGFTSIKDLRQETNLATPQLPSVSIIFSALNEEATLETAARSLLNLNYPKMEIIAINDRSTDATPHILSNLAEQYGHLKVYHIQQLPENWLGKNHALHFAAEKAQGEWLLFTDADVIVAPEILTKAVSFAIKNKLDHLTIYERHLRNNFWLKVILLGSYISYCMAFKPWRVSKPWSKKSIGHGAFNLVKKDVYQAVGGHRCIALSCLDDLMLGKIIKNKGYKQAIVTGGDWVKREWYQTGSDMIEGLKKNSFAFFNFSSLAVAANYLFAFIYYFLPLLMVIIFSGPLGWVNGLNIILTFIISIRVAIAFRMNPFFAFLYPLSMVMILYIVLISLLSTYKNKGVIWRDTHYPLEKLKHHQLTVNEP